jgi:MFS family permease
VLLGVLFVAGALGRWSFEAILVATFFFTSAGASAAYLTVSEIFPMETRALAIAVFYATGTAAGGVAGPLLLGHLIATKHELPVAIGFWIGAAVMSVGTLAEVLFGPRAKQLPLEELAPPLPRSRTARATRQPREPAPPAAWIYTSRAAMARAERAVRLAQSSLCSTDEQS